jgi:cytochrome c oxidase subunit 2
MVRFDREAIVINVTGRQWKWDFEYENGKKTSDEYAVPVGKPIRMVMTSTDVLHSFFIPSMRVKKDVVPGMYTSINFTPVKTGTYNTFCTEYCGKDHSAMLATLHVLPEAEYKRWVEDRSDELLKASMSPVKLGKKLYAEKGCNACHSLDGAKIVGPTFLKLFGSEKKFADGTSGTADEEYIRASILNPNKQIVEGYPSNLMPVFEGQVTDDELKGLVSFIRSLDGSAPVETASEKSEEKAIDRSTLSPEERGKWVYENKLCMTCHSMDGSRLVGPSFKGIIGRQGKLADGAEYQANEEYIKNSIREPASQVVEGYAPAMPAYGEDQLSDDDIAGVVAWMKTIK